jgi:hypothetical protein
MKIPAILLISLLNINNLCSQTDEIYTVKAGEIIPAKAIYTLPAFAIGTAFLKDGTSAKQPLNFNCLTGEMQFINRAGDTLAIADPGLIKSIVIDTLIFYYGDKNFMQQVLEVDSFKLCIHQQLAQLPGKVAGGYGTATENGGTEQYHSINTDAFGTQNLRAAKDMAFKKVVTYYIGNQFNLFYKADKNVFFRFFFRKKVMIQQFLKDNNINFSNRQDLQRLLQFCVQ